MWTPSYEEADRCWERVRSTKSFTGESACERKRKETGLGKQNSQTVMQTGQALCHPNRKRLSDRRLQHQAEIPRPWINRIPQSLPGGHPEKSTPSTTIHLLRHWLGDAPRRLWSGLKSWGQPRRNTWCLQLITFFKLGSETFLEGGSMWCLATSVLSSKILFKRKL